jgi:hypothetical protein
MTGSNTHVNYNAMAPFETIRKISLPLLSAWPVAEPPGGLGLKTQLDWQLFVQKSWH